MGHSMKTSWFMEGNEPNSTNEQPIDKKEKKKQYKILIALYHLVNSTCNVA